MKITIALIALAIFGTSCRRTEDPDRTSVAMTHISGFHSALGSFNVDCGRFPTTLEGLSALIGRPPTVSEGSWRGPYLLQVDRDPWGNNYCYLCPGLHNTNSFDVYSRGPDGLSRSGGNDSDDINNWSRNGK
jgi:general secretion pathway protein G